MTDAAALRGFELGLLELLVGGFHFAEEGLKSVPLQIGRQLFSNFLPEVDAIVKTAVGDAFPYEPSKEPSIAFYTNAGPGVRPSSSHGGKYETSLQVILRAAGGFQRAKALLEELVEFLLDHLKGQKVGDHLVRGVILSQRPVPFQRQGDDRSFASSTLLFRHVSIAR